MEYLLIFVITFIFIYLVYYLFVIHKKKTLIKWQNGKEMTYLKKVYKIKIKESNLKTFAHIIALDNAFIVALTLTIISVLKNFIVQMLVGFIVLSILIILTYHIIGKYFQKKGRI